MSDNGSPIEFYHKNPRQITVQQFENLERWLEELGDLSGIVHDLNSNQIVGGNQRGRVFDINECEFVLAEEYDQPDEQGTVAIGYVLWKGYRYGYRQVRWTEEQCEMANIVANKAGGDWDFDILANEFELEDLLNWGFIEHDLDLDLWNIPVPEPDPGAQIDRADELREKWGIETGQLWRLGDHKLVCGDCTDAEVVARLMDGESYNILTDPPYNIGFDYESIDDKMTENDYQEFCHKWFTNIVPDAIGAIFTPGPKNERLYPKPRDKGIWLKRNGTAGASCFHYRKCEPILFFGQFNGKRDWDLFDYSSGFDNELKEIEHAAGVGDSHAPAKAMKLWEELVNMLQGGIVLDTFLGTGTTLIACERLNRKCRAVEISPAYCAVAIQRWVDMTSGEPELITRKLEIGEHS